MNKSRIKFIICISVLATFTVFQNCAKSQFSTDLYEQTQVTSMSSVSANNISIKNNMALNKRYQLSLKPNYTDSRSNGEVYYTSVDDGLKLTDGRVSSFASGSGFAWVQPTTLGWSSQKPVITIDLGSDQPISGLSLSTVFGLSGVFLPDAVFVFSSIDGKSFRQIGELVSLSSKVQDPPLSDGNKESPYVFSTTELKTHGRFIAFVIDSSSQYIFVDEIEIYQGSSTFLNNELRGTSLTSDELNTFLSSRNIALNKSYRLSAKPNYQVKVLNNTYVSQDSGSTLTSGTKLTDGIVSNIKEDNKFAWVKDTSLGWASRTLNQIYTVIDLGSSQPIGGVSFVAAGGASGVEWPKYAYILVSNDGINFTLAGEIIANTANHIQPAPNKYATFNFITNELETNGRYVAFVFENPYFLFLEEIKVYRGLRPTPEPAVLLRTWSDLIRAGQDLNLEYRSSNRMHIDLEVILNLARLNITNSEILNSLIKKMISVKNEINNTVLKLPSKFIIPFNETHRSIFKVQAELWRALKLEKITIWQPESHWDFLDIVHLPPINPKPALINIFMMKGNEHRSGSFYISNSEHSEIRVQLALKDLPKENIKIGEVFWVDTKMQKPVNTAINFVNQENGYYYISIPSGMTREVWFSFNANGLSSGVKNGKIELSESSTLFSATIPVTIIVSNIEFEKPTLHLGGWDYINNSTFAASAGFKDKVVTFLKDYFVDLTWEVGSVIPYNTSPVSVTDKFDNWVKVWGSKSPTDSGARVYAIFLNPSASIIDATGCASIYKNESCNQSGTDHLDVSTNENIEFNNKVKNWLKFWVEYAASKGINANQLMIELKDEPNENSTAEYQKIIIAWARAIKKSNLGVKVFVNPTYSNPSSMEAALLTNADIVSPLLPQFITSNQAFRDYYVNQNLIGKELAFYSCLGPAFLLDPDTYYRHQSWNAARYNITTIGYWSFYDPQGFSSWRDYEAPYEGGYTPYFFDKEDSSNPVTTAKQMEAIREGMEDYSYIKRLKELISKAPRDKAAAASVVLESAYISVLDSADLTFVAPDRPKYYIYKWHTGKRRSNTDVARKKILEAIEGF